MANDDIINNALKRIQNKPPMQAAPDRPTMKTGPTKAVPDTYDPNAPKIDMGGGNDASLSDAHAHLWDQDKE